MQEGGFGDTADSGAAARPTSCPIIGTRMSFQWLKSRITEEKERRDRDARIRARLPDAVAELGDNLAACLDAYCAAFPTDAATLTRDDRRLTVQADGKRVEVLGDPQLPGFQVRRGDSSSAIQVGFLPGDRL